MSTASRQPAIPQPHPSPATSSPRPSRLHATLPLPAGKPLGILVLAVLALLIPVLLIELPILHHTHGNVLYPLDKAFVNMTVGRTLAFYQVWGVSKYAFQSAATSLLYPITLAPVFFIAGCHLVIPLIVNFLAAAYFLLMLQRTLIRYGLSLLHQLLLLLGAMIVTLLPLLVVSGMEYVLQLLFVFLFVDTLATPGKAPENGAEKTPGKIVITLPRQAYLYALLAVAARYEDLLIIALACLLLVLQNRRKTAAKLVLAALAPVIVFGIISLCKKSYFLPNALLLGPYPICPLILTIIAVAATAWLIIRFVNPEKASNPAAPETRLPPQPPVEAHLPPRLAAEAHLRPRLAAKILLLLTIPFSVRNGTELAHCQRDCERIYDAQFPAADFIHLYFYKSTVGINEPGAASYFSEGRKLDYTGLASLDITGKKRQRLWSPLWADSLSRKDGIRAAIVSDPWFSPRQLPRWTRIATWVVAGNPKDSQKTINFYAINPYDTSRLRKYLHEYQAHLPATVSVRYY